MTWLTGYNYRKKCTVAATAAGAQSNYQLKLIVGESSGAAGEDVDCDSHCEDFPNDIRFTNEDGETKHDYWVDTGSLTGVTPNRQVSAWIEVASIPASGTVDLYIYYGKSGDGGESNGGDTFQFFDDFERGNDGDEIGGSWTEAAGTVEISTGQAYGGTRSMKLVGVEGVVPKARIALTPSDAKAVLFRLYKEDAGYVYARIGDGVKRQNIKIDTAENVKYIDDAGLQDTGTNITADVWQLLGIEDYDWTAHTFDIFLSGSSIQNDAGMVTGGLTANVFDFTGIGVAGVDTWIDNFIVRNYASPEPTWGSFGSEQTEKTKESSIGLAIRETFTKESSIGLAIRETFTKESSIGLTVVCPKTKTSSIGLTIQETFTKESSIGLAIRETFTKESSIGLAIRETFTKESSIGLTVVCPKTKTSSIGLTIQETFTKESSITISVKTESEVVSIIGITTVTTETKESTLGMTIEGHMTKESSIGLSVKGTFTKESSITISVRDTFTKGSSIGLRVVTSRIKESSISLSIWDTRIKESSIGIDVLAYHVKDSTIGMYVKGFNIKESFVGMTIIESVLKKGFYYAKLGNIALEGVEEDNFRISKEINQIPSFNYEIANCADNRTTITDNITEEFKIYWRHHGTDTPIFRGIINADGIEYISLDSIEITGYASYVVLSWPLLKHLAAEDAEPVNKVFDFYGAYTDLTTQANNATINDVVLSLSNGNHGLYIGENQPFWGAQIKYSTKGIQAEGCSIVLEYSKGTGVWGTLDALDESDAFVEEPGTYNLIIPHPPSDWARNIVDGVNRYWIRWRLTAGAYSTPPKLDQIYIVNIDVYRTYYFDTSAREILLNVLEGTEYTMDATDSCPEDDISLIAEYESPLRVIAAIPNALTWTDTDGSKKAYQWWIDDAKKVHMKKRRGTTQSDDITGDMAIFNNQEDYFHLSNRLIGLGPRDGLGQMRAIIEDKTSIGTHTLREIAVTKEQILKYNMLKTSLEKDIAISKNPMQRIRGKVTTEFWGLRGYEVGDTVTLHQGKWNVAEKGFQIVKAEIGPNMTTIDLGISQDHLNGLRNSLQRQLTLNNVRMHGSTTIFEAGPETSNYQRKSVTEVYSAKLNVEIPTDVKKIHKFLVSWTLGPYRASVDEHTTPIPAHDHDGWAGGGGGVDSDFVGLGGAFTPDVDLDGAFIPQMIGGTHGHLIETDVTLNVVTTGFYAPTNTSVGGLNHRHIKGRTSEPDDTFTALAVAGTSWNQWCEACSYYLIEELGEQNAAAASHWHLNADAATKYTGYVNPNGYINTTYKQLIASIDANAISEMTNVESPTHEHDGIPEDPHDHAGVYQDKHNDHSIPLEPPHSDHAIVADTGGELDITYGIHEVPGGTTMELLVNDEKVAQYTTAQTEVRIDGWLATGNNIIELRPVVGENKKGGAAIKGHGLLFIEPKRF